MQALGSFIAVCAELPTLERSCGSDEPVKAFGTLTMLIECRCGSVAVELSGAPVAQFYCHCADCQAVHGAAFVPVALYRVPFAR